MTMIPVMNIARTYLPIIIILLCGCGKQSDSDPIEKAEKLTLQASEEIAAKQYAKAERLLTESIELYSAANNSAKLAEQYASLASVQLRGGKLHPALHSFNALRNLYKQTTDRGAELNAMLEIGRVNFRLGRTRQAITLLEEAYLSSQLFQLHDHFGESAFDLAKIYSATNRHHKASTYYSEASAQFLQLGDTTQALKAITGNIGSLLAAGSKPEAAEYFDQFENLVLRKGTLNNRSAAYSQCARMFIQAEEYELASNCSQRALFFADQSSSSRETSDHMQALIGLGETYYCNYAFTDAQSELTKAYTIAKKNGGNILQAYLLIRIADCEMKKAAIKRNVDQLIRVSQLYESAQTLFTRAGFGLGEAIVLHRLGMLKEFSGDDNSAITHYKRAFEKFSDNNLNSNFLMLPLAVHMLHSSAGKHCPPEEWFTERLAALLLKYKKSGEALDYIERARSISLVRDVTNLDLQFGEKGKQTAYDQFLSAAAIKEEYQLELSHFSTTAGAAPALDKEYAAQLQQKVSQFKSSFLSASSQLAQQQPDLKALHEGLKASTTAERFTPSASTVLRYYFVENDAWVFVLRQGKELTASKLSSHGFELEKKMQAFISLISSPAGQSLEIARLSRELYLFLIKPVEQFGQQRFIIVPPDGMEKFPFHALIKEGKSLIELIEVSYLPSVLFLQERKPLPKFITNVVGMGFLQDTRWGLEFELRDIRSFFRNVQVFVNQAATVQRLTSSTGEMLQLSSTYRKTEDKELTVTLSDGSASILGINVPISVFTSCHPFNIVYLSDTQTKANDIDKEHSVLWLLNGTPAVVTTEFPLTQRMSRMFGENFYSSFSTNFNPYLSYRRAMLKLATQKEFSDNLIFASYFFYGL